MSERTPPGELVARWEGFDVRLDGTCVRFGEGEHDWVHPYPPPYPPADMAHPPLQKLYAALVRRDGAVLTVVGEHYNFEFYAVTRKPYGFVFHYRSRKRRIPYSAPLRELAARLPRHDTGAAIE